MQLKEFYLFLKVANGSEEDVKEFYKFSMKYIDEEKVAKQGPVDLMKSTCDLFKVIEGLGNIEKCDEKSIEVKVQLTYYEDSKCYYIKSSNFFICDLESCVLLCNLVI